MNLYKILCKSLVVIVKAWLLTFLVPETSVHDLQYTAINSSSISLTWNISHPDKINGPLLQFVITYYPSVYGDVNSTEARTSEMVSL